MRQQLMSQQHALPHGRPPLPLRVAPCLHHHMPCTLRSPPRASRCNHVSGCHGLDPAHETTGCQHVASPVRHGSRTSDPSDLGPMQSPRVLPRSAFPLLLHYNPIANACGPPGPACTQCNTLSTGLATRATAHTATMRAVWQFIACLIQVRRRRRLYRLGSSPAAAGPAPSPPLVIALCRRLQVTLAAIAIAVIRTRVMVNVYIGYYCAFELNNAQMCTPTIGVAATSIVLSGLVLILIAVRPRGRGIGGGQPSLRYSGCSSASLHHVNTPPSLPAPTLRSLKHPPTPLAPHAVGQQRGELAPGLHHPGGGRAHVVRLWHRRRHRSEREGQPSG